MFEIRCCGCCRLLVVCLWSVEDRLTIKSLEPSFELFVEEPILFFELDCSHVLLLCLLLVVEGEEEGFEIKIFEVFSTVVHRYGRIVVLL
jgi:hypothetical protein